MLRLLGQHAATFGGWPQNPRVIDIDAEGVSFPCDTVIGDALEYRGLDRKTKCVPAETRSFFKVWAWPFKDFDIRGINVPGRPQGWPS